MSDIDFDELDKAVNTLMSNVDTTKRSESADDPEDKVLTLDGSTESALPQPVSQPDIQQESITAAPIANATPSAPALAVKRRGQFMDMIHPSSDMKATKAVKREAATVTPVTLDASSVSEPEAAAPVPAEPELPENIPTGEPAAEVATEQSPLVSPFLPDAKPEKRPLGAASDIAAEPNVAMAAELDNELTAEGSEQQAASSAEEAPALPAELHTDVLAVEAAENTATESAAAIDLGQPEAPLADSEEQAEPSIEEPTTVPAGGSIPQQYTEAPSSGDQTNGSIYDTSNYHQPIEAAPATKKSSPLKWILLAVGLLVLGGGGGVAYFLLTH